MGAGASLAAIERLYRSRYADFLRTAAAIADSREAGRDAVHDAFVAAVASRRSYRDEGTLEAWVWPMVVRGAVRRRRQPDAPDDPDSADAIWTDRHDDETSETRIAVAALPQRQRLMVFLRYYGDLDYQAIADLTGVRVGTVGAELHAARRSLLRRLQEVSSDARA